MADSVLGQGFWVAIAAAAGAVLVKVLDRYFGVQKNKQQGETSVQLQLHKELGEVRAELREEVNKLRASLVEWQDKHYDLLVKYDRVLVDHQRVLVEHRQLVAENLSLRLMSEKMDLTVQLLRE